MIIDQNSNNNQAILTKIVEDGDFPRYLYKYTTLDSLELILKSSSLKFSKPSEFNDPFDCNITIDTNNTSEEIETYIESLKQNRKLEASEIETLRQKFHNPKDLFLLTNQSVKNAKESFGISCFSKNDKNIVMWAHYADKNKGACLKFDILADTDFFMTPFFVNYKVNYPKFNYINNRNEVGRFLLETKSDEWAYEKEIRVMKQGHGFYCFLKESLIEIIFGVHSSKTKRDKIKYFARKNNFNSSSFKTCRISETKFELEIV